MPSTCAELIKSVLYFRCLCLAGCNINQRNSEGIKAEITALKYGYNDIGDLLSRLRNVCVTNATILPHTVKITFHYNRKNSYMSDIFRHISKMNSPGFFFFIDGIFIFI
jgi:ankyrin repeat protein